MVIKRRQKDGAEIPTSSMADIAFLLLIFFLVSTTINTDKGIDMMLPDWGNTLDVPKRNIMNILIDQSGQLMVDGNITQLAFLQETVRKRSEENDKLIVSLKPHKSTEYDDFIAVMDQIKLAGATRVSIADPDK